MSGIIEGLVGGSTQITVANDGSAVILTMRRRDNLIEEALSVDQCNRLRKLLGTASRRAFEHSTRRAL